MCTPCLFPLTVVGGKVFIVRAALRLLRAVSPPDAFVFPKVFCGRPWCYARRGEVTNQRFLLFTQPRWIGFKLTQEGTEEERDFDSIPAAFAYARTILEAQGVPFVVFDERGLELASLTV